MLPAPAGAAPVVEQVGLRMTSKFLGVDDPAVGDRVTVRFVDRAGAPFPVFVPDGGRWAP